MNARYLTNPSATIQLNGSVVDKTASRALMITDHRGFVMSGGRAVHIIRLSNTTTVEELDQLLDEVAKPANMLDWMVVVSDTASVETIDMMLASLTRHRSGTTGADRSVWDNAISKMLDERLVFRPPVHA